MTIHRRSTRLPPPNYTGRQTYFITICGHKRLPHLQSTATIRGEPYIGCGTFGLNNATRRHLRWAFAFAPLCLELIFGEETDIRLTSTAIFQLKDTAEPWV
jgi:hypothetical protein